MELPFFRKFSKKSINEQNSDLKNISDPDKQTDSRTTLAEAETTKIIGGFLGDRDPRTRSAFLNAMLLFISIVLIISGAIFSVAKYSEYKTYLTNNTTPINTTLTFRKTTNANLKLASVWTDRKRDLLVIRLQYTAGAHKMLPYRGTDYHLYLAALQPNDEAKFKNLRLRYGLLDTDGDGYLFIKGRQLPKQAYQVLIANEKNLVDADAVDENEMSSTNEVNSNVTTSDSGKADTSNEPAQNEKPDTISSALSEYNSSNVNKDGVMDFQVNSNKKGKKVVDNINFRVNPYSKSTIVFNGDFLNKDGNIDYAKVIDKTSIKQVLHHLNKKIHGKEKKISEFNETIEEYQSRLKHNPDDKVASENVKKLKESLREQKTALKKYKKVRAKYKSHKFTEHSFISMNKSFYILTNNKKIKQ